MKRLMGIVMICCISIILCTCGQGMADTETKNIEQHVVLSGDIYRDEQESGESELQSWKENCFDQTSDETVGLFVQDETEGEAWKQAYLSYLETLKLADSFTYSLIYVDDDDIPELVIDTGIEAGGCLILTFDGHVLDEWQSDRLNVTYIERGNLICNADGNFGHYYDWVYMIQNGKWEHVGGGEYGDEPGGPTFDENGDWICVYSWNGENVSEEEYQERLNAIYPAGKAVYPQKYYILDEIYSILRTEVSTSAGRRYDLSSQVI
ncbi:MAG: hypothetical protein K2N73_18190 [Lachnospiraceae bacterium]|nr:hypothetical protein [Lachnospiraceae bacterium]